MKSRYCFLDTVCCVQYVWQIFKNTCPNKKKSDTTKWTTPQYRNYHLSHSFLLLRRFLRNIQTNLLLMGTKISENRRDYCTSYLGRGDDNSISVAYINGYMYISRVFLEFKEIIGNVSGGSQLPRALLQVADVHPLGQPSQMRGDRRLRHQPHRHLH